SNQGHDAVQRPLVSLRSEVLPTPLDDAHDLLGLLVRESAHLDDDGSFTRRVAFDGEDSTAILPHRSDSLAGCSQLAVDHLPVVWREIRVGGNFAEVVER